jgi:hypothetical protein
MRIKALTTGLLLGLLAGCGGTNQGTTVQSTLEKETVEPNATLSQSPTSVGEAAKLTPAQIEQLRAVDNTKGNRINFKVVLPAYIPTGFQVKEFKVRTDAISGPSYKILYRNSNNACFTFQADNGQWGGPSSGYDTIEVFSPVLGKVLIEHTHSDRLSNAVVGFRKDWPSPKASAKTAYSFGSAGGSNYMRKLYNCERAISLQETVKIVESLQFLNP